MPDLRARRTAATGGVLLALRFAAASVLNYGFGVALIWLLPKADFGGVGVLQNVLLLAATVLGGGYPWVVARTAALADTGASGGPDTAFAGVFRAALLGNIVIGALFVAVLLGTRVLPDGARGLVPVVAVTVLVMSVVGVLNAGLQGNQRFDAVALQQTTEIMVKVVLGLTLVALVGAGVTGVGAGFLAGTVVAGLLCVHALRDRLPGPGSLDLRRTTVLALPMAIGTSGFGLLITLDVLALSALSTLAGISTVVIATYQAAAILARTPYYLAEALGDAAFPNIARGSGSSAAHDWFVAAFRWIPLALVPLQLVLVVAPEPILRFFLPGGYTEAAGLVRLLSLGTTGLMISTVLFKTLYATGFAVAVARRLSIAAALEVAALVALVPRFGAIGAGIAFAVGGWTAAALLAGAYLGHHRAGPLVPIRVARYLGAVAVLVVGLAAGRAAPAPLDLFLLPVALLLYGVVVIRLGLLRASDHTRIRTVRRLLARRVEHVVRVVGDLRWVTIVRFTRAGLLCLGCVAFVVAMFLWNLSVSPDTQYDEVVYSRAAQQVAQNGDLTWTGQPLFVHPPMSFLAQASWLLLAGRVHAPLPEVINATRLLAGLVSVVNVGLLALIAARLTPAAARWRKAMLVTAVVVFAATDPILVRYGRLAIIEPFALFACLATLNLALALRRRPARIYLPAVGLATGLSLLTNEIGIFLLVTPLVHALLGREWRRARTAAGAIGIGVVTWLVFPLWAQYLGLLSSFLSDKTSTLQRLLGLVQSSGWNRPGASFVDAVIGGATQYLTSYLLLAGGSLGLLWLVCHRLGDSARWLLAWLLGSYGFAAYTVVLGTLNEQFFIYVLPAAVVGTVLVGDAALSHHRRVRTPDYVPLFARDQRTRHRRSSWRALVSTTAVLLVVGLALTSWVRNYVPRNDGLVRAVEQLQETRPICSAVNASGDAEKLVYLLPGYTITDFATGPAAVSHGVQLFFVGDKDAELGYGNSSPQLAQWVRSRGVLVSSYPSMTYHGVELWWVPLDAANPLSGVESVPGGEFVLEEGSRCAGFPVVDVPGGYLSSGWTELGGKAQVGSPLTASWSADGEFHQVFTGGVLATDPGGRVRALPVIRDLAERDPNGWRAADLPPVTVQTDQEAERRRVALLTDPAITARYLRAGALSTIGGLDPTAPVPAAVDPATLDPAALDPAALDEAQARFGLPLGPPETMPDGQVRQAFDAVVMERPTDSPVAEAAATPPTDSVAAVSDAPAAPLGSTVRLAPVGALAVSAGGVDPPSAARTAAPPAAFPDERGPAQPSTVVPFLTYLGIVAVLLLLCVLAAAIWTPAERGPWHWRGRRP